MRVTRRLALIGVSAAAIIAAMPLQAQAAPTIYTLGALPGIIGEDQTAGSYLEGGRTIVNVTNAAAAERVEALGATARIVSRSMRELNATITKLNTGVPGTAWWVDPVTNQVVVDTDESVTGANLDSVGAAAVEGNGAVRINKVPGKISLLIAGGNAIYTGGSRCSLGFNAQNSAGVRFFVTAGHCTNAGAQWRATSGGAVIGNRVNSSFPGNDYGVVQFVAGFTNIQGTIANGQNITSAGNAVVGQAVRRHGSTTGNRGGNVTATGAVVNYPQGTVTGMIRTTVCAQPGDSGGSMYAGSVALGLTSGGSGNCTTGGITFFNPVIEALNTRGLTVL